MPTFQNRDRSSVGEIEIHYLGSCARTISRYLETTMNYYRQLEVLTMAGLHHSTLQMIPKFHQKLLARSRLHTQPTEMKTDFRVKNKNRGGQSLSENGKDRLSLNKKEGDNLKLHKKAYSTFWSLKETDSVSLFTGRSYQASIIVYLTV